MEDAQIRAFLKHVTETEIMPHVPPPPATDLQTYRQLIERRFSNPKVGDTISRLCLDGSNRQPKFILPTAADRLAAGGDITGLALVSAMWCRYCYGLSESGKLIPPNDPSWTRLHERAREARARPEAYLEMRDIFGALSETPAYVGAFTNGLSSLWTRGVRATLQDYLEGRPLV
jgi:mannitol 2-dehydrogenase